MTAFTNTANTKDKGITPLSTPALMMLPAEIRLEVYKYIDPRHNLLSKYAGLRATCRQLRTEFDHEALKAIRRQYARRLPKLHCNTKIHPERPIVIADVSTINVRIPLRKYHPGTYTCAPRPDCFSWSWLKTLIVTFDLQKLSNDASPYYDPSFDIQAIILSQINSVTTTMHKRSRLSRKTEIDTAIFKWANKPPSAMPIAPLDQPFTLRSSIEFQYWYWTNSCIAAWSHSFEVDDQGVLSQYTWRRRRRRSKREKWIIQHLTSFLLLLETWYMRIKHAWPFISRFIRSVIVYTCLLVVLILILGAVLYGAALAIRMLVREIVRYGAALTV